MRFRLSLVGLLWLAVLLAAAAAPAATLVGGREQSRIARDFFSRHSHQGQAIVSTRISTVAPAWAVVKSVRPRRSGPASAAVRPPVLQSSYYHVTRGRVTPGSPPAPARSDLARDFRVAVVYTGSGSETIAYHQLYRSVCAGSGGFTDQQDVTVKPMSWSVRYVVDLDVLQSAVRGPAGTVLVPAVSFARSGSRLSAREALSRTAVDRGCNGKPTTYACTSGYALASPSHGLLSFATPGSLEIGVPITPRRRGDCDASDYTLGPSLWNGGATTVLTAKLGLVGTHLPAHPYAPIRVSWPTDSEAQAAGFPSSPCQGDGAACRDTFRWTGHVALQAAS